MSHFGSFPFFLSFLELTGGTVVILIFASSLQDYDPQTELLIKELRAQGKTHIIVNPLKSGDLQKLTLIFKDGRLQLFWCDLEIIVETVYMSRMWRNDCIIDLPERCIYPTFFRNKVEDFLIEISVALKGARWFPGSFEDVRVSEVKCSLFRDACSCGLHVPHMTVNAFKEPSGGPWYRKVLGYPFSITLNTQLEEEVAVTLLNNKAPHEDTCSEFPWQWQTPVEPQLHIRCVVVNDTIWCFCAEEKFFKGKSLREVQIESEVNWQPHELPAHLSFRLRNLMKRMNLKMACPEFLLDSDGNYIFIDLNPCGDWFGFLNTSSTEAIAKAIVSEL